jgi:2-iminobutanoate/2-iminopropanoate deaminase
MQMTAEISVVHSEKMAPPGGCYSHAINAGGFVFVSGQLPVAGDGKKLTEAPFENQVQQSLNNVEQALIAGGSSVARLVQVRVYLTDIEDWPVFNQIYAGWVGAARPARAVVPVPSLHYGFKIEVEAVGLA